MDATQDVNMYVKYANAFKISKSIALDVPSPSLRLSGVLLLNPSTGAATGNLGAFVQPTNGHVVARLYFGGALDWASAIPERLAGDLACESGRNTGPN